MTNNIVNIHIDGYDIKKDLKEVLRNMEQNIQDALSGVTTEVQTLRADIGRALNAASATSEMLRNQIKSLQATVDTLTAGEAADQSTIDQLTAQIATLNQSATQANGEIVGALQNVTASLTDADAGLQSLNTSQTTTSGIPAGSNPVGGTQADNVDHGTTPSDTTNTGQTTSAIPDAPVQTNPTNPVASGPPPVQAVDAQGNTQSTETL